MRTLALVLVVLGLITARQPAVQAQALDLGRLFGTALEEARRQEELRRYREQQERIYRDQQIEADRQRRMTELEERRRMVEQQAQQKLDDDFRAAERERARKEAEAARERAQKEAEVARERAQREADAARERAQREAEAERHRARVLPPARDLVGEASEFVRANPQHPKILQFVERVARLNSAIANGDPSDVERLTVILLAELQQEPSFEKFRNERELAQRELRLREMADLTARADRQRQFLLSRLTQDPTARHTSTFLTMVGELSSSLGSPELQILRNLTQRVEEGIRSAGLQSAYGPFQPARTAEAPKPTASGNEHLTAKNRFLLEGALEDVVLMFNTSPKAPNVARNLRGDVVFNGARARACWFQEEVSYANEYVLRRSLSSYQLRDLETGTKGCQHQELLKYDVVATQRGAFLNLPPHQALSLLKEIELDHFKALKTLSPAEMQSALAADEERGQVERSIETAARDQYGVIVLVPTRSDALCVATSADLRAHRKLLLSAADRLAFEMGKSPVMRDVEPDAAFLSAQRDQCGALYASAADLKVLRDGLRAINRDYRAAAVRISDAEVADAAAQLSREDDAEERQRAEQRQQQAERQRLDKLRKEDEQNRRDAQERRLRDQYGKLAAAKVAEIEAEVRAGIEAPSPEKSRLGELHPQFVSWFKEQLRDRWEVQTLQATVYDYGVVQWKGRELEAPFAQTTLRLRNRVLGEYKDVCFILARINDLEFKMVREPVAASCQNQPVLSRWKKGFDFTSRWFVE